MIKANELRIGNWVKLPGVQLTEYSQVELIDSHFYIDDNNFVELANGHVVSLIEGIPLTPEILEKAGFSHATNDALWNDCKLTTFDEVWWIPGMYFLEHDDDHYCLYHSTDEDTYWELKWVKYLHDLQNCIFALSGEELNITL